MYARFHKAYYGIDYFETLLLFVEKGFLQSLTARDKTNPSKAPPMYA